MQTYLIGRSSYADIILADPAIAAYHAELVVTADGRYHLTDCGSESGTFVRETKDDDWRPLRQEFISAKDEIRFGNYSCGLEDLLRHAGLSEDREEIGGKGARDSDASSVPLRGPVERDPVTGEIVRRRR
jgi:pSer/pThr/pTyr-binding forkhead associated (FHA) protein